jgi:hypothetical protein
MALRRIGDAALNISALISREDILPDVELNDFFRACVFKDGCRTAAWLIGRGKVEGQRVRRILVAKGEVDFTIPANAETPPWFRVGMEYLKRRKGWSVVAFRRRSANDPPPAKSKPGPILAPPAYARVYRVTWHYFEYAQKRREERWQTSS